MQFHPIAVSFLAETTGKRYQLLQSFSFTRLKNSISNKGPSDTRTRTISRHHQHIAIVQTNIHRTISIDKVVVHIQTMHHLAISNHPNIPERTIDIGSTRQKERIKGGGCPGQVKGSGHKNLPYYTNRDGLDVAQMNIDKSARRIIQQIPVD